MCTHIHVHVLLRRMNLFSLSLSLSLYSKGTILRCLIVYSIARDVSKGYGFVEFSTRDEAVMAKYVMATKEVGGRHLRVDFADNGMVSTSELHSKTLFVDKLPKNFSDNVVLKRMFEVYGVVNFCQVRRGGVV